MTLPIVGCTKTKKKKKKTVEKRYIIKIIDKLKNKKSLGIDGISNCLIKLSKNVLVKPPAIIINQMLNTGIFPSQLCNESVFW